MRNLGLVCAMFSWILLRLSAGTFGVMWIWVLLTIDPGARAFGEILSCWVLAMMLVTFAFLGPWSMRPYLSGAEQSMTSHRI